MLQPGSGKGSTSAAAAFEALEHDVWIGAIIEHLEPAEIAVLRAVSTSFRAMMSTDDVWLDRLTILTVSHPALSDLEKGADETAYAWYTRCYAAVDAGNALALGHLRDWCAYLDL
mmetsp:Transcript_60060/g.133853  ORF Transcript_60060/g.133853 Transcript_60060/m.133853 type:complete len:115 (-) Transcript_60060:2038-2382(-)